MFSSTLDPLFVIMEYVSLGKLQTFLRENRRPSPDKVNPLEVPFSAPLTSTELTQFGYQVAKGMEYIASKVFNSKYFVIRTTSSCFCPTRIPRVVSTTILDAASW